MKKRFRMTPKQAKRHLRAMDMNTVRVIADTIVLRYASTWIIGSSEGSLDLRKMSHGLSWAANLLSTQVGTGGNQS